MLIVDHDWIYGGLSAEWQTQLLQQNSVLQIERMGHPFIPCPTSPTLESVFYPTAESIASKALHMISGATRVFKDPHPELTAEAKFRGPF